MSKCLEALCYLDDIAHGRKMKYDPHELKLLIEKELKAKDFVFDKLSIKVREIHYKDGIIKYQLCFNFMYAREISKEEFDLLKEILCEKEQKI